jgi:hypothetical protein
VLQQPIQGSQRLLDSFVGWNGAALECNDTALDVFWSRRGGSAEELCRPQSALPWQAFGNGVRDVARAGEIICNDAEKQNVSP